MRKLFFARTVLRCCFALCFGTVLFSCDVQFAPFRTDCVTVSFPEWPPDDGLLYPELTKWKITVRNSHTADTFFKNPGEKSIRLELKKDGLASIRVIPVTQTVPVAGGEFFFGAGCVYPADFSGSRTASAKWENGAFAKIAESVLSDERFCSCEIQLRYFNWQKLKESLNAKENKAIESFSKKSTKPSNGTSFPVSFYADISSTVEKIYNPPPRFSLSYFKPNFSSKNSTNLKNYSGTFLSPYIPMNRLLNEKGWVTVFENQENNSTAFLADGTFVPVIIKN